MTRTDILGLAKREPKEKYNLEQNNANMDIIDTFADVIVQATPTVPATAEGNAIVLNNSSDKELIGLTLNGNTTQSGTPTPENPIDLVSVENPVVTINGKNLLKIGREAGYTETNRGIVYTINEDKSISVSGTPNDTTNWKNLYLNNFKFSLPKGNYKFVCEGLKNSSKLHPILYYTDKNNSAKSIVSFSEKDTETVPFTITDENKDNIYLVIGCNPDYTPQGERLYISIFLDSTTDLSYEPYKSQTLEVPYTLNGVGEVKDYVDFERGVLVRNCKEIIVDGTNVKLSLISSFDDNGETVLQVMVPKKDGISPYGLCSHLERNTNLWIVYPYPHFLMSNENGNDKRYFRAYFKGYADIDSLNASFATNPMTIIYLTTPTETSLTAEELEAFKQLTSYYPVTTITNSENAEMSVEYKADTKTVLKEKLDKIIMR